VSKPDPSRPDPKKDQARDKTQAQQDGESAPRLPHEHDQSTDSQATPDGKPPEIGKRGHDDIERGVVDTDRGPVVDKVYNEKVKR